MMIKQNEAVDRLWDRLQDLEHGVASARMIKLTLRMIAEEVRGIKARLEVLEEIAVRR